MILHNAVNNACTHGAKGGSVTIDIHTGNGGQMVIMICNAPGPCHSLLMSSLEDNKGRWWDLKTTGGQTSYNVGLGTIQQCAEAAGFEVQFTASTDVVTFRIQGPYVEEPPRPEVIWALDDVTQSWTDIGTSSIHVLGLNSEGIDVCVERVLAASPSVDVLLVDEELLLAPCSPGVATTLRGPDVAANLELLGFTGRVVTCPTGATSDERQSLVQNLVVDLPVVDRASRVPLPNNTPVCTLTHDPAVCLFRLMYISTTTQTPLSAEDISRFEDHNRTKGITGMLVHVESKQLYIHMIEGTSVAVLDLWVSIQKDTRHNNIQIVYANAVPCPRQHPMHPIRYITCNAPAAPVVQRVPTPRVVIWALDDVALVRRMLLRVLSSIPGGNIDHRVMGSTDEEISEFTHRVMHASPPVDIVILDNVLSSPTQSTQTIYGLDVAASLVLRGFEGAIVMSSSNDLVHTYIDMPKGETFASKRQTLHLLVKQILSKRALDEQKY